MSRSTIKDRPSIALAIIVKNEAHNLGPLLQSVEGCFDQIHITDTGSTDSTIQLLNDDKLSVVAKAPVFVSHFKWCDDFAKARNYNFSQVPKSMDYVMWMDADDVLSDKDAFIHWRDNTLHTAHRHFANYNYAYDNHGNPACTFFRERVIRNNYGFYWKYFIHEGIVHDGDKKVDDMFCPTWTINHSRTKADEKADRNRNIAIFEKHKEEGELDPRMQYYYAKELFDAGHFLKSVKAFEALSVFDGQNGLDIHDRIMAQQYLSMAYGQCGKWDESLTIALNGLRKAPERSELLICVADALVRIGNSRAAKGYYEHAKHGESISVGGTIYTSPHARLIYPYYQLAHIYLQEYNWKAAEKELQHLEKMGEQPVDLIARCNEMKALDQQPQSSDLVENLDIVISTPPGVYVSEYDENVLQREGLGGSETALVEVARLLHQKTKRPVKVFQKRRQSEEMPSGVEYLPIEQAADYFRRYKPSRHIAWRHANDLTPAKTYVWSHDLITPGIEKLKDNMKLWCLTEFHKNFVHDLRGVSKNKIDIVQNGIEPKLFENSHLVKIPHKVIFSSSPDRGWERAIEICKRSREVIPDLELHLFYGTGNMRKAGHESEANRLDNLVAQYDWVKYHGFVDKQTLVNHFLESAVWLYPADFIETSCITAMEALCAGAFPLVRNMGALRYTLKEAYEHGMCDILDLDAYDDTTYSQWADKLTEHLLAESYKKVDVDRSFYSWENRIEGYIKSMNL